MKKSIILGIVVLLVLLGAIFSTKTQKQEVINQKNKVAATIFPVYDIARIVAGDDFDVVLMLPSGSSPHTFDPQPGLIKSLEDSQAIFAIGNGLDSWSDVIAESINIPVVVVDKNIDFRSTVEDEHGHEDKHLDDDHDGEHDHSHGPIDPHYWLSISNAKKITYNIADELGKLDPVNKDLYTSRATIYSEELDILESELQDQVHSFSNRNIISLHDAWYYFAESFNLNLVGTFEPSAGKEPTPQYLHTLEEEVNENNVSTLFVEPQLSQASINAFAKDHNLNIAVIDPLGGKPGRDSYIELMRYNIEQVVGALSK